MKRKSSMVIAVLVLLLVASVSQNWISHEKELQNQQLLLNYGVGLALAELSDADAYFSGYNPNRYTEAEIINEIARASGHFESIQANLNQMQITHVGGIGEELKAVVLALSEPDKYSSSQIKQYKQFVHEVVVQLKQAEDGRGNVIKSKLQKYVDHVYQYMPAKDKQELYFY